MWSLSTHSAGERCKNRIVEWVTTVMLLNFGLTTFVSPDTLMDGSFRYMVALGFSPTTFAWGCGLVGVVRACALYYNGYGLPWSARVRALTAIFGAVLFALMGLSLVYLTRDTATLSLGAGTHFTLAAAELYSCLRAGADVTEKYRRDAVLNASRFVDGLGDQLVTLDNAERNVGRDTRPVD
jgi:hypothetical protein